MAEVGTSSAGGRFLNRNYPNESGLNSVSIVDTTVTGNSQTGVAITSGGTGFTTKTGMIIEPIIDTNIVSVTKASYCSATTAYIQSAYASGVLGSATFVGNVATFASPIAVTASTEYYLLVDGGTYNQGYASASLPITSDSVSWNHSVNQLGASDELYCRNFVSLTWSNPGPQTVTITYQKQEGRVSNLVAEKTTVLPRMRALV